MTDENKQPFSEENLAIYIGKMLDESLGDRTEYDKKLDKWWRDFRDIKLEKLLPFLGCSNWSVPMTSSAIDAIIPRIVEAIFDLDVPVIIKAMNTTAEQFKEDFEKFVCWDIDNDDDLKKSIWFFILNAVALGTGFVETTFQKEKETVEEEVEGYIALGGEEPIIDPETGERLEVTDENTLNFFEQPINSSFNPEIDPPENQFLDPIPYEIVEFIEKKTRWKKFNPTHEIIESKDIYFPAESKSLEDAFQNSGVFVRKADTKDFLRRMLKQDDKQLYSNLDETKIDNLQVREIDVDDQTKKNDLWEYLSKSKKVEYWRCFVKFDVDDDGIDEQIVALYEPKSKKVFGWEKFPYKHGKCPITEGCIKPLPNKVMGVGLAEMLYDTKGLKDHITNSLSDKLADGNDPVLLYTKASKFNPYVHQRGFAKNWRLGSITPENIRFLETPKNNFETFKFAEEVDKQGERRSNIDGRSQGVPNYKDTNDTKGGIQAVINEGNFTFRHYIRWISLGIREILSQRYALFQQYWGDEADEEVADWIEQILDRPDNPLRGQLEDGGTDKFEAIKQNFNIVLKASNVDKDIETQKAKIVLTMTQTEPLYQEDIEAKIRAIKNFYQSLGIKDTEGLIPSLEKINERQTTIQAEAIKKADQEKMAREAQSEVDRELDAEGAMS